MPGRREVAAGRGGGYDFNFNPEPPRSILAGFLDRDGVLVAVFILIKRERLARWAGMVPKTAINEERRQS